MLRPRCNSVAKDTTLWWRNTTALSWKTPNENPLSAKLFITRTQAGLPVCSDSSIEAAKPSPVDVTALGDEELGFCFTSALRTLSTRLSLASKDSSVIGSTLHGFSRRCRP